MAVQESIGTKFAAAAAVPATYDAAGFAALSPYEDIGEVTEVPEHGGQAETIRHTPLATGIVQKFHGAVDYGSLSVPLALDNSDAGQIIVKAAFASRSRISFRATLPDGAIHYFAGKAMSEIKRGANSSGVVGGSFMLEIETALTEVAAP